MERQTIRKNDLFVLCIDMENLILFFLNKYEYMFQFSKSRLNALKVDNPTQYEMPRNFSNIYILN